MGRCMQCVECPDQGLGPEMDFGDIWMQSADDDIVDDYEEVDDQEEPKKEILQIPGRKYDSEFGKARRKKQFVEAAPSHDGKPCFAAYQVTYALWEEPDDDDEPPANRRPLFGIRIYDVTPEADADRAKDLVVKFDTLLACARHQPFYDRLEVVAVPLDAHLSDLEKAKICTAYDDAERASRMATCHYAFYIPPYITDRYYRRGLVMIDRLEADSGWENLFTESAARKTLVARNMEPVEPAQSRYGSFSVVKWQPRPKTWEEDEETPPPADHAHCLEQPFEHFAYEFGCAGRLRRGIETFYIHYVDEGRLDHELQRAKEAE
ncbi:hypothetical protein CONLIGDRAFT_681595 [Coniochaeta ligniaria NRRL 30616]|uniref:Uncharacterized protein n=1 Tax=Coniochaeta ligniaria NRRL 30616 TaxID=1408157 RepID=A0A1J7JLS0_9PEZI|nr:hypothetical protein CONLIGDRAFT_681595 [Coniochaeta ligniaria NRRL 30616]